MKLVTFSVACLALSLPSAALAQKMSKELEAQVKVCTGLGYKKSCCIASYGAVPAGGMKNSLRHQEIAKCSGVPPKG